MNVKQLLVILALCCAVASVLGLNGFLLAIAVVLLCIAELIG